MKKGLKFSPNNFNWIGYLLIGSLSLLMVQGLLKYYFSIWVPTLAGISLTMLLVSISVLIILMPYMNASRKYNRFIRDIKLDGYPTVYYRHNKKENKRWFYIEDRGEPYTEKLIDNIDALARANATVILDEKTERNGRMITMEYKMMKQEHRDMRSIIAPEKGTVEIATGFFWQYLRYPHGVIVGRTGEGKSVLAQSIMRQLCNQGAKVYYMDPKNSGKTRRELQGTGVEYHSSPQEMRDIMVALRNEAYERDVAAKEYPTMQEVFEEDWRDIMIVFDELAALPDIPDMDKKLYSDIMGAFQNILFTGRESHVQIIALCQRADAAVFGEKKGGGTRSNFSFRCAMGVIADDDGYNMIFPDKKKVDLKRHEKGAGLACMMDEERPREIIVPFFTGLEGGAEEDAPADDDSTSRR